MSIPIRAAFNAIIANQLRNTDILLIRAPTITLIIATTSPTTPAIVGFVPLLISPIAAIAPGHKRINQPIILIVSFPSLAASFFVSGIINQFLQNDYCYPTESIKGNIIKDITCGIRTIIENKTLTVFIVMTLLINIHIAAASFTAYFIFSGNAGSVFPPVQYTYFIMAGTIGNIIGLMVVSLSGDRIFNVQSLAPLLLMMMLCRLLHFTNSALLYVCIINGCIFIIIGILNSLLDAYTMRSVDEQYLGQYYTAFGNLNALLAPLITYTLGYILRGISPASVYASSALILLFPVLYIHKQIKNFD